MRTLVSRRARSRDIVVHVFPGQRPDRLSVPDRKVNGLLSLVCAKLLAQRVHDHGNRLGNRFRQVFDIDRFHRTPYFQQNHLLGPRLQAYAAKVWAGAFPCRRVVRNDGELSSDGREIERLALLFDQRDIDQPLMRVIGIPTFGCAR